MRRLRRSAAGGLWLDDGVRCEWKLHSRGSSFAYFSDLRSPDRWLLYGDVRGDLGLAHALSRHRCIIGEQHHERCFGRRHEAIDAAALASIPIEFHCGLLEGFVFGEAETNSPALLKG